MIGVNAGVVDGAVSEMAGAKITLNAACPGAHESEIECSADYRAGYGDQAAHPFFGGFFAEFQSEPFSDARREFFNDLFFGEIFSEVDAGGGRRGQPELALVFR